MIPNPVIGRHMMFDVESVGLHGEGFAVAWVVLSDGKKVHEAWTWCDPRCALGTEEGAAWVAENVDLGLLPPGAPDGIRVENTLVLRELFWTAWLAEKELGTFLWADCAWPVEARFLGQCVEDSRPSPLELPVRHLRPTPREWDGPYPLLDVSTLIFAAGGDPLGNRKRLDEEFPDHHPLADARQSARILAETGRRAR